MQSLSVCCVSNAPAARLAAALGPFRGLGAEIVVAADTRVSPAEIKRYAQIADRVFPVEYESPQERFFPWLVENCSGEWVLRMDSDETPSAALLDALPLLLDEPDVLQYWIPRRWLWPDATSWLDEFPWWPDHQPRLNRNDPATLWWPGILHSSAAPVTPARYIDAPMYHLDCLLAPEEARVAKALAYEAERPGLEIATGYPTNSLYLPERYARGAVVAVPAEDRALIQAAFDPAADLGEGSGVVESAVSRAKIDERWPGGPERAPLTEDGYSARLEIAESDFAFRANRKRPLFVRVKNEGIAEWSGGVSDRPRVKLGYRWLDPDDGSIVVEGERVRFSSRMTPGSDALHRIDVAAPRAPGRYVLEIDLLHEYVRWFGRAVRTEVDVAPAVTAVDPRSDRDRIAIGGSPDSLRVTAAVFASDDGADWDRTISSLRASEPDVPIILGGPGAGALGRRVGGAALAGGPAFGELLRAAAENAAVATLVVATPARFPRYLLADATSWLAEDPTIGAVGFQVVAGPDPETRTRRRRLTSAGDPVAVDRVEHAVVVFSKTLIDVLAWEGSLETVRDVDSAASRGRARGLATVVDTATVVTAERRFLPRRIEAGERDDYSLASAMRVAEMKIGGLRVIIDGGCFVYPEMGTQVQALSLIKALAADDEVDDVFVALFKKPPDYARPVLASDKVRWSSSRLRRFEPGHVMHRPFQPEWQAPVERWREAARRVVVTLQDLIAYQTPNYHETELAWISYRTWLRKTIREADGAITISEASRRRIKQERIPIEDDRIFVAPNGVDHLPLLADESPIGRCPDPRLESSEFLLVLGADYAHKNRDLAVKTFAELRRRGRRLTLVLAGATVPFGGTRRHELAGATEYRDDIIDFDQVDTAERDWLLQNARALLYPTSAEGFGFIPHEAARFGTPSVFVRFGPLAETTDNVPVEADGWSVEAFTDATQRLLDDAALEAAQVNSIRRSGAAFTWKLTARRTVEAYKAILAAPPAC